MEASETSEVQALDVDKAIRAVKDYMKERNEQKPEESTDK
jgi:hypothetical protein